MTLEQPYYLLLMLLIIPMVGWYVYALHRSEASMQVSSTSALSRLGRSPRVYLLHIPFVLRVAAIVLLSIALARPQLRNQWHNRSTEGIDIMMALDISGTMLAEDLQPTRLEAAKAVATNFVKDRVNDNIGLVVFAGESFTQCPMTTDHAVLINLFRDVKYGMIEDGTAIGLGLANAVNRMKDSETKSKVIILLTDGSNNRGDIDPITAAEIANTYNIRVYTIGVGSYNKNVTALIPTPRGMQRATINSEFDETTLRKIAQMTGGEYFRAQDNRSLQEIYDTIDKLEKSKIRVQEFRHHDEGFMLWLLAALAVLLLEMILRYVVLRTPTN